MDRVAGELTEVWIVRDPTPLTEMFSEFAYPWKAADLPTLIIGTGAHLWASEHTKLYTDQGSAKKDGLARLQHLAVEQGKKGLHLVQRGDLIHWVTVPARTATRVLDRYLREVG